MKVPTYLYKLVYDATTQRAWAHWQENREGETVGRPISYQEWVKNSTKQGQGQSSMFSRSLTAYVHTGHGQLLGNNSMPLHPRHLSTGYQAARYSLFMD